jgi:hypothetical protein
MLAVNDASAAASSPRSKAARPASKSLSAAASVVASACAMDAKLKRRKAMAVAFALGLQGISRPA